MAIADAIKAITNLPAATLSAYAAAVAAAAAASVALLQFIVGYRQSNAALKSAKAAMKIAQNAGKYRVAEFRQKWIDDVRQTLASFYAQAMRRSETCDQLELLALKTRLRLLLNPDEAVSKILLDEMEETLRTEDYVERKSKAENLVKTGNGILKTEWDRIKGELNS